MSELRTHLTASLTENTIFESIERLNMKNDLQRATKADKTGNIMKSKRQKYAVAKIFQSYPRFKKQTLSFGDKTIDSVPTTK